MTIAFYFTKKPNFVNNFDTVKRFLLILGLLDLISVVRSFNHLKYLLLNFDFYWLDIAALVLYTSLLASGIFLIRGNKIGIVINYIQFPLRLLLAVFSFGFLLYFNPFSFQDSPVGIKIISSTLVISEVGRLLSSIIIHRRLTSERKASTKF